MSVPDILDCISNTRTSHALEARCLEQAVSRDALSHEECDAPSKTRRTCSLVR